MIRLYVRLLMGPKDMANTGEGVADWRAPQTLITIRGHLAIAQDFSVTPTNLCILVIIGSILIHVGVLRSAAGFLVIFSGLGFSRT